MPAIAEKKISGQKTFFHTAATFSKRMRSIFENAMKLRLLFTLALSASCCATSLAQSDYYTGFDNTAGRTGWQQFRKGAVSQFQQWSFDDTQGFSAPASLIHNYPVGGSDPMDDWFVSPAFNFSEGGMLDSLRFYFSGFGTPQSGDTVFLYLLNGSADPDLADSQEILFEFSGPNYVNDNTWRLLAPIALPAQSGSSYIAFRYKTIVNWLDVRFDNFAVSVEASTAGMEENVLHSAQLFPNPVTGGQARFDESVVGNYELKLFDAAGKMIYETSVNGGESFNLLVPAGMYFYRLTGERTFSGKISVAD
jgi:hypothetical protein